MKYPADQPCPRPGEMIVVRTVEGDFWRMKPKKKDDGKMNEGMEAAKRMLVVLSPIAAKVVHELGPYLNGLQPRRITVRVKKCIQTSVKAKGEMDYSYFERLVFQPDYPVWQLMKFVPKLVKEGSDVVMRIPIPKGGAVTALNSLVSGYRLALVMLVGDPLSDEMLSTYECVSPIYERGKAVAGGCELRLLRPDAGEKWLCMLRIVSYEDGEVAKSPRHGGMKVVGWG